MKLGEVGDGVAFSLGSGAVAGDGFGLVELVAFLFDAGVSLGLEEGDVCAPGR